MKKIALMTWHHIENYGTAFQAYALKNVIESMGYSVDLIDYNREDNKIADIKPVLTYIKEFILDAIKNVRQKRNKYIFKKEIFISFYEECFTYTNRCKYRQDFEKLNSEYDGFVCGSDQIWGPKWFDGRFFLDFVNDSRKKIAYAPSFGVLSLESFSSVTEIKKLVKCMDNVSVREKSGCDILTKLTGRSDIKNVIDPVLLAGREYWLSVTEPREKNKKMLIFFLRNNDEYYNFSLKEAKRKGLNPIVLHCTQSEDNVYYNEEMPTPFELLNIIRNSSFVCTDSFHILVFSIIFNVPFIVFNKFTSEKMKPQNGRLIELLELLGIHNRIYNGVNSKLECIDFKNVNIRLDFLKKDSFKYLDESLKRCTRDIYKHKIDKHNCENCVQCYGQHTEEFNDYIDIIFGGKWFSKYMKPWNFSLNNKCYNCEKLFIEDRKYNNTKPLFYDELIDKFKNKKGIVSVYIKYYLSYQLSYLVKKFIFGR